MAIDTSIHKTREFHGLCKAGQFHALYWTWANIKKRCYYHRHPYYHLYGGRGIKVCERWLHSFTDFIADIGERPSPQHTIDRINKDGDYEPNNVRWATAKTQARNNRNAKLTIEQARFIRVSYAAGITRGELRKLLNISRSTVNGVINGTYWKEELQPSEVPHG